MADTCVSCEAAPEYSYQVAPQRAMLFCASHVPGFLKGKNGSLLLKSYKTAGEEPTPAKTSKKKKTAPVVEEPVVDEVVEEEPSEEETPTEE